MADLTLSKRAQCIGDSPTLKINALARAMKKEGKPPRINPQKSPDIFQALPYPFLQIL